ncbi:glycosyltransferase [Candidatus Contubernalis alkaliaceticus]|uniref:glycosyltransferase n=1 Tax=Candidatus Contubernalis alkaliaceticus TaxID=338645 RepID=UPI001F4C28BD|nr:glycosyltransferase [Candidatus Contubernalis alkalaceticus]UNC92085.1 glycosyltransferase family 1 protein [Candidatus Contubernalis alkalaceticus]
MRVLILTIGTRGDIEPYVGLAQALIKDSIPVTLVTNDIHKKRVQSQKIDFFSIDNDNSEDKNDSVAKLLENQGLSAVKKGISLMFDGMEKAHYKINKIVPDYDVVIGHGWFGELEADLHNKKFIRAGLNPSLARLTQNKLSNSLKNLIGAIFLKQLIFKPYNEFRTQFGGASISMDNFYAKPFLLPIPTLLTPVHDFEASVFQSDYWFPDYDSPILSEELDAFLHRNTKKLLVSFGSITWANNNLSSIAMQFVNAGRRFGFDTIWVGTEIKSPEIDRAANEGCFIQMEEYPFHFLLPKVDLIAHHCGLGTTCSTLRAGVPTIPVPHLVDQFDWAKRLYQMGIASKPIHIKNLNERAIINRLESALKKELYSEELLEIKKKMEKQVQKESVVNRIREIYKEN